MKAAAAATIAVVVVALAALWVANSDDGEVAAGAQATTTTSAGDATVVTTDAVSAAGESTTSNDSSSPASTTTTTVADLVTTTTAPDTPVDERLPRTESEATDEDPVPVGEVIEAAPGTWDIALTGVDLDAADTVAAFADINPSPEPGFQYVLVTMEGTYLGESVAQPVFEWAVFSGETEYLPSIPGCGFVPGSIYDIVEVAPGESFAALLCMPVAAADVASGLELLLNAPGDDPRYFDLTGSQ